MSKMFEAYGLCISFVLDEGSVIGEGIAVNLSGSVTWIARRIACVELHMWLKGGVTSIYLYTGWYHGMYFCGRSSQSLENLYAHRD